MKTSKTRFSTDWILNTVVAIVMVFMVFVTVYPLYFSVVASVSEPADVATGNVTFWPKGFTTEAYKNVFVNDDIWTGYRNSMVYMLLGTLLSLCLTIPAAYVLSKKSSRDAICSAGISSSSCISPAVWYPLI